ncbi:MAG: sulfite exporter TauE/SafE family protein [Cellvibrionaceae bacterium]|nr:sulfite exporter TauE/SafE family protein [Cellvibrionaceae bacterium]
MTSIAEQALLFAIALSANTLSAIAGGGSGLLQLPALIFLGLPFSVALATHKIATVALGAGATLKHLKNQSTDWRFSLLILAAGLPGVVLGAKLILRLPEQTAKALLGLLTIALGIYSLLKKQLGQRYSPKHGDLSGHLCGGTGLFIIAVLNGSLASGTGLFVTLWLIGWYGLDYKRATAYTMILVGLFWNGAGALTLSVLTPLKWQWLPALILGSLLGGYLGAALAIKYGNPLIKRLFEAVTISVGVSLLIGVAHNSI